MRNKTHGLAILALSLFLTICLDADRKEKDKHSARVGNLVVTATAIETPEGLPKRILGREVRLEKAPSGHYFVVVRVRFKNVGKRAICADFLPRLKADFGLEYRQSFRPDEPRVSELLPDQEVEGPFTFEVKEGAKPLELTLEPRSYNEGCRPPGESRTSSGSGLVFFQRPRIRLEGLPNPTIN